MAAVNFFFLTEKSEYEEWICRAKGQMDAKPVLSPTESLGFDFAVY